MADIQGSDDSRKVLFIDDDFTSRHIVSESLSSAGYDIETAIDGESGLKIFESHQFDIVITDLVMPEPDGLKVLQVIKRKSPQTPVIVLSGLGGFDDVRQALKLGAYDYLTKEAHGIDPVTLCSAVDRAWEYLRLVRENAEYQRELETKVADRTRDLQATLKHLREYQKELGDRQYLKYLDVERSEKKYRTLIQNAPNGIATLDSNLHITDFNKAFIDILEFDVIAAINSATAESNQYFLESIFPEKIRYCISTSSEISGTGQYLGPNDESRFLEYTLTPISLDEHDFKVDVLFTVRDVTLENEEKRRLQEEADFDDLTGLLKHGKFGDTLKATLENIKSSSGTLALIHIDVDKFRDFNTEHGHPVASEMLKMIGRRIKASISSRRDFGFRTGGDEFGIILTGFSPDTLEIVVERLINKLSELYSLKVGDTEKVLKCTFSTGVVEYSYERNQTAMEIYEEADKATYQAKDGGRNQIAYFEPGPS
jgi:diguanylate cyclase (GGDEF)-like protein/PAS domain S-box-containing protein